MPQKSERLFAGVAVRKIFTDKCVEVEREACVCLLQEALCVQMSNALDMETTSLFFLSCGCFRDKKKTK